MEKETIKLSTVCTTIDPEDCPDSMVFHSDDGMAYCRISFEEFILLYENVKSHMTPEPDHMDAYDHGYKNGYAQGAQDMKENISSSQHNLKFLKLPGE